jgi:phosphoribosylaminoimidazole-succinocarboxamide synthase
MINEYHIDSIGLATPEQMAVVKDLAWKINDIMKAYFAEKGIILVDFKLEFGVHQARSSWEMRYRRYLPVLDAATKEKLDKDRFRRDLGNVEGAYEEVWRRIQS